VGGALGIAIIGSVMASAFTPRITSPSQRWDYRFSTANLDDNLGKVMQFAGIPDRL
jgi:hypothetical protein